MKQCAVSELKKTLRAEILLQRRDMEEYVRKEYDEKIYNNLIRYKKIVRCDTFLVYASSPAEVDTRHFITAMLSEGRTVAVPKCVGKEMRFLTIRSLNSLVKSRFGVDEPADGNEITAFDDTVCIVPALRFDRSGYRLGWGGGFYDRFLAGYSGYSIGICYEQCCGDVPRDGYDLNVNTVITENGIYY